MVAGGLGDHAERAQAPADRRGLGRRGRATMPHCSRARRPAVAAAMSGGAGCTIGVAESGVLSVGLSLMSVLSQRLGRGYRARGLPERDAAREYTPLGAV